MFGEKKFLLLASRGLYAEFRFQIALFFREVAAFPEL